LSPVDDVINTTSTKNSQPVVVSRD
jgi:hypothetical protein